MGLRYVYNEAEGRVLCVFIVFVYVLFVLLCCIFYCYCFSVYILVCNTNIDTSLSLSQYNTHSTNHMPCQSAGGEVAHRQTHGALHPRVNLGRADQVQASQARAVVHRVMVHGQIVPTMDVSSLFVDVI